MYGQNHSEEQWEPIGTCSYCESPLYLMGETVKWHDCIESQVLNLLKIHEDTDAD